MSRPGRVAAGAARLVRSPWRLVRRGGGAFARRPRTTVALLVVVVLLLGGAAAMLWREQHRDELVDRARSTAVEVAGSRTAELLSYEHSSVDAKVRRVADSLTRGFRDEYSQLMTEVVAPAAKQQQVTTTAKVSAASVISATPQRAVCLLFVNQTTEAGKGEQRAPRVSGSRVRVSLQRVDGRWLVSGLEPV